MAIVTFTGGGGAGRHPGSGHGGPGEGDGGGAGCTWRRGRQRTVRSGTSDSAVRGLRASLWITSDGRHGGGSPSGSAGARMLY